MDKPRPGAVIGRRSTGGGRAVPMLEEQEFNTADIYVTVKRRRTLGPKTIEQIAESMFDEGQRTPIVMREDGSR